MRQVYLKCIVFFSYHCLRYNILQGRCLKRHYMFLYFSFIRHSLCSMFSKPVLLLNMNLSLLNVYSDRSLYLRTQGCSARYLLCCWGHNRSQYHLEMVQWEVMTESTLRKVTSLTMNKDGLHKCCLDLKLWHFKHQQAEHWPGWTQPCFCIMTFPFLLPLC